MSSRAECTTRHVQMSSRFSDLVMLSEIITPLINQLEKVSRPIFVSRVSRGYLVYRKTCLGNHSWFAWITFHESQLRNGVSMKLLIQWKVFPFAPFVLYPYTGK
ncbi:hypothetical protein Y032_0711g1737 [Ancylostoma ceylanicum]|nr:hypothetical protein Y032_0711g1737 [Ancylostoma ceylanicum]